VAVNIPIAGLWTSIDDHKDSFRADEKLSAAGDEIKTSNRYFLSFETRATTYF